LCVFSPLSPSFSRYLSPNRVLTETIVGITGLNQAESTHLVNSTLPAPNDPTKFIVQLNVFHQLHCVNLLRKAIYKDEYPGWEFHENGRVNHDTVLGLHWGSYLHPRRSLPLRQPTALPPILKTLFNNSIPVLELTQKSFSYKL